MLIKENDAVRVEWAEDTPRDWTPADQARLCAMVIAPHLEAISISISAFVPRWTSFWTANVAAWAEAARQARFPLRSQSFALAYYSYSCTRIGFNYVARTGRPGLRELRHGTEKREFNLTEMSSGQLHFLLENRCTFFDHDDGGRLTEELIYLLRERFRWEPYHVQLAVLYAVGFARGAPEERLERLVEAINALDVSPTNWAINSSIIDALKILGAIDDHGDETQKRGQARAALGAR